VARFAGKKVRGSIVPIYSANEAWTLRHPSGKRMEINDTTVKANAPMIEGRTQWQLPEQ